MMGEWSECNGDECNGDECNGDNCNFRGVDGSVYGICVFCKDLMVDNGNEVFEVRLIGFN